MEKRVEWKVKQDIVDAVIQTNGTVFGGYVRDMLLHDYHALEYYKACQEKQVPYEEIQDRYSDPSFLPETKDRLVIPKDIDCYYLCLEDIKELTIALQRKNYKVRQVFHRLDACKYIQNLNVLPDALTHIRYSIHYIDGISKADMRYAISSALPYQVKRLVKEEIAMAVSTIATKLEKITPIVLDILVRNSPEVEDEPPFSNLDFECNSLLLSKNGIRISNKLIGAYYTRMKWSANALVLSDIVADIMDRKAIMVRHTNIQSHRIEKMKKKGWNIVIPPYRHILLSQDTKETCIICNEELSAGHYKMRCCNARYHHGCLLQCATKGTSALNETFQCIMCKRSIFQIDTDIAILRTQPFS